MTDMTPELRLLEAFLFATPEAATLDSLQRQMGESVNVPELLQELKQQYQNRGVNLVEIDGQWTFRTAPDLAPNMKITRQPRRKLPRAAAEVLAIIAYHQPLTRGDIESIRGVETSKGSLDILLELGWIRPGKRRDTPGRPLTWHTTPDFLSHFNLESLKDLPGLDELKAAGLLDARPVLSNLPRDQEGEPEEAITNEEEEFSQWIKDEPETDEDPPPSSTAE